MYYSYLMNSIPQWFVRFSQLRLYSKTQEEPYDLLFFLSKFYQATLYYTLNGELTPSSYLAAFADVVILFRFTKPNRPPILSASCRNAAMDFSNSLMRFASFVILFFVRFHDS